MLLRSPDELCNCMIVEAAPVRFLLTSQNGIPIKHEIDTLTCLTLLKQNKLPDGQGERKMTQWYYVLPLIHTYLKMYQLTMTPMLRYFQIPIKISVLMIFQRSPTRSTLSPAPPHTAQPSLTTWTSLTLLAPTSSMSWHSTPLIPKTRRICARWPLHHLRARSVMGSLVTMMK